MMRAEPRTDDVICPNVAELRATLGLPHSNQLNALKASALTSICFEPPTLNERVNAMSRFLNPGPRTILRTELPSVPAAGCAKAFGSIKRMPPFAGLTDWSA